MSAQALRMLSDVSVFRRRLGRWQHVIVLAFGADRSGEGAYSAGSRRWRGRGRGRRVLLSAGAGARTRRRGGWRSARSGRSERTGSAAHLPHLTQDVGPRRHVTRDGASGRTGGCRRLAGLPRSPSGASERRRGHLKVVEVLATWRRCRQQSVAFRLAVRIRFRRVETQRWECALRLLCGCRIASGLQQLQQEADQSSGGCLSRRMRRRRRRSGRKTLHGAAQRTQQHRQGLLEVTSRFRTGRSRRTGHRRRRSSVKRRRRNADVERRRFHHRRVRTELRPVGTCKRSPDRRRRRNRVHRRRNGLRWTCASAGSTRLLLCG